MNPSVPESMQMAASGACTALVNISKLLGNQRIVQIAGIVGGVDAINYTLDHATDPQFVVMALALAISLASERIFF
jgi:hypothetical protein